MKSYPLPGSSDSFVSDSRSSTLPSQPQIDLSHETSETPLVVSLEKFFDLSFQISESLEELVDRWQPRKRR